MTDPLAGTPLADIKPGTKLTAAQSRYLDNIMGEVLSRVHDRRKGILLVHDSLQNTIGLFLQYAGFEVTYEVPFETGGFAAQKSVFDIVAVKGKRQLVVEVKDAVTTRDLGQVYGYISTLKLSKTKAAVLLGTDILNYGDLVEGAPGKMVSELLERELFGILLADKYALVEFDNLAQLHLKEMPAMLLSEEKVG